MLIWIGVGLCLLFFVAVTSEFEIPSVSFSWSFLMCFYQRKVEGKTEGPQEGPVLVAVLAALPLPGRDQAGLP
jgi:hypothetical protein